MIVDLHNHTTLCNHAKGTIDEYIYKAIEHKTQYFGFSDHAPMDFDQKYRMTFAQMKTYEQEILDAKNKYQDKIEILLGYEVDYLPGYMDDRVLQADVDYLIGSIHFLEGWGFDNPEFISAWKEQNIDEVWQQYFDTIEKMANSKLFDIVGHLDLIKIFEYMPQGDIIKMSRASLMAIKKADMSIELNSAGYRKNLKEPYPSKELLQVAFELDIPITFSSDAHAPQQIAMFHDSILQLAKDVGYTECVYYKKRKRHSIKF